MPFEEIPEGEPLTLTWPTENQSLFSDPSSFFARTRVNPDYGLPGWTRDCGKRFHKGCDIAPMRVEELTALERVTFTDGSTGKDFESEEPTFRPLDRVLAVCEGQVEECCREEGQSDYGLHVVLRHLWPLCGEPFFTLYAHLANINDLGDRVEEGAELGVMGLTSRITDARKWMSIAPHLHFEVWNAHQKPMNPVEFLRKFLKT
jgi:hypothetical protein